MSAFADDPDHFVRWLGGRAAPQAFVSRRTVRRLRRRNCAARAFERPRFATHPRSGRTSITRCDGEYELRTASGASFAARAVVLATGNAPPDDDALPAAGRSGIRATLPTHGASTTGTSAGDVLARRLRAHGPRRSGRAWRPPGIAASVFVVSRRGRFPGNARRRRSAVRRRRRCSNTADARALAAQLPAPNRATRRARGFDWRVGRRRGSARSAKRSWKRLGAQGAAALRPAPSQPLGALPPSRAVASRRGRGERYLAAGRLRPSMPGQVAGAAGSAS